MKAYVLWLYLCCQPLAEPVKIDNLKSPEMAAVIFWQQNQDGHCYEGKLMEYDFSIPGDPRIHTIPIPKVSFK